MIGREFRNILKALAFFTIIPIGRIVFREAEKSFIIRYFPFWGLLVGGVGAFAFYGGSIVFNNIIASVVSVISMILLTGALHEDGLADVSDGFLGGRTKDSVLSIMKDSHNGTYGVLSLFLIILLRIVLISSIDVLISAFLIFAAQVLSRFFASQLPFFLKYARSDGNNKSGSFISVRKLDYLWIIIPCIIPIIFFDAVDYLLLFPLPALLTLILMFWFRKRIEGYTGDCIGAVQQLTEVTIYISGFLIWKFI